jgi:hypothetical protein
MWWGGCGMGGCGSKKSPRLQYGVENGSNNVDFTVTVKIPENYNAKETATLQVGGPHIMRVVIHLAIRATSV